MGKFRRFRIVILFILLLILCLSTSALAQDDAFRLQNERLLNTIESVFELSPSQMGKIRKIFMSSGYIGQGNPTITKHPITEAKCRESLELKSVKYENTEFEQICGSKYMAPLYDPNSQKAKEARVCIDRFEFPNIPCTYPVVWVRSNEAALICATLGKRLCDAHEWEGACAGSLLEPDYPFELAQGLQSGEAVRQMRIAHNKKYIHNKQWGYGREYQKGICAAASRKSKECTGGSWTKCGSNTYPSGFFPECTSALSVYDIHGNAAEHMNLPLNQAQMASLDSTNLGYTEMKGSWFIFDRYYAHQDWCRWRAPFWHGSRVMDPKSHRNYHLGFRCCKSLSRE